MSNIYIAKDSPKVVWKRSRKYIMGLNYVSMSKSVTKISVLPYICILIIYISLENRIVSRTRSCSSIIQMLSEILWNQFCTHFEFNLTYFLMNRRGYAPSSNSVYPDGPKLAFIQPHPLYPQVSLNDSIWIHPVTSCCVARYGWPAFITKNMHKLHIRIFYRSHYPRSILLNTHRRRLPLDVRAIARDTC